MKRLIQLSILSNMLISSAVLAINNPVQGFYGGFLAGISHGPSKSQIVFEEQDPPGVFLTFTGKAAHSVIGAGGGGVLGYRLSHFRLEGEILYNRFSTGPLRVDPGGCTIENSNILTPTGECTPGVYDRFRAKALGFQGSSAATYGLINFYYDFYTPYSDINWFPYIGLGIGKARVRNFSNFVETRSDFTHSGINETFNTPAAQGILGLGGFMDDFTWAGMDLRYTTTKKTAFLLNKSYNIIALMFNINFAFDKGGIDCD